MYSKKIILDLYQMGLKIDSLLHLEPLGDEHFGHIGTDVSLINKAVKRIAKAKNRITLFMGDQLDAINIYDKRYNPDSVLTHEIDDQRQNWQDAHEPIFEIQREARKKWNKFVYPITRNEKVLGLLHGNHEYKIRELNKTYIENLMCRPNGLDFIGSRAMLGISIQYKGKVLTEWTVAVMHGTGGGQPETMLRDMKKNWYADVFLCGHLHQKRYHTEIVNDFNWDAGKCEERSIHLANTGSFQATTTDGVDGYMDRKNGLVGGQTGTITMSFDPYSGKVSGHI